MPRFSRVRIPLVVSRRVTQRFSVSTQKRCVCRLGRKRRRFLLLAWETRLPAAGFLPVISQRGTYIYLEGRTPGFPGRVLYQPGDGSTRRAVSVSHRAPLGRGFPGCAPSWL